MCDGYKADFSICAANTKTQMHSQTLGLECDHYIGLDKPMHSKFVTTTLNKTGLEDLPLELYCFMDVTSVLDASFQSSFLLYYTLPVKSFRSVRFFCF